MFAAINLHKELSAIQFTSNIYCVALGTVLDATYTSRSYNHLY